MNLNNLTTINQGDLPEHIRDLIPESKPERTKCNLSPYQISHFQVGVGASGVTETSAVVGLGGPLTDSQYGGPNRSVEISQAKLLLREDAPLTTQSFGKIQNQGIVGMSSLVSVMLLDEDTANGLTLNEVGLFVDNPFMRMGLSSTVGAEPAPGTLGGGEAAGIGGWDTEFESPGHLIAAYRHMTPIQKENYFSLLIRWSINFTTNRS